MEERTPIECNKCSSNKFILIVEQEVSDCFSDGNDPVADHTINKEDIHLLKCAKCGNTIIQSFLKKPIPKKDWEEHWSEILFDHIHSIESLLVNRELEDEDDKEEAYLRGIVKGMWGIYNFIENLMVQDKLVAGRKTTYHLSTLHEIKVKAK